MSKTAALLLSLFLIFALPCRAAALAAAGEEDSRAPQSESAEAGEAENEENEDTTTFIIPEERPPLGSGEGVVPGEPEPKEPSPALALGACAAVIIFSGTYIIYSSLKHGKRR
ncbi:MAG: hypothetical protein Q4B42_00180 [Oscillospiraceae bacterium]|nr:hypothetical protein [Oscillospiraceae bacterium]